ncbi:cell division inhibitor SepF [Salinibacillus kushneri]|uniref:Cell division protein SepF n=1 Tax=Salinibacillus kushneri TaxID=237682 RepID=A0A1I0HPD8_9BACI|nr:cell division protein SepF [Salinibacillus kushneri]SET84980.1 cell division inhibitor SepF [Salinibacillus kushneri]
MSIRNKFKSLFTFEDEYEYVEEETEVPEKQDYQASKSGGNNVVHLESIQSTSKVVLCEPKNYDDCQEIADHIKNRRAVVINLQRTDHHQAKRIVDFLSGTVYAVGGIIQKLGQQTFLCAPDNIDVSGSITDLVDEDLL